MLAELVSRFCALLRAEGLAVGPDRAARFATAVVTADPAGADELYWCALATLTTGPDDIPLLDTVFAAVFGDGARLVTNAVPRAERAAGSSVGGGGSRTDSTDGPGERREGQGTVALLGSAEETLAGREFTELSDDELLALAEAMRGFRLATPVRRSRRRRPAPRGKSYDMRETLRAARGTGAEPILLRRSRPTWKPRGLVVLCDISGSMRPHARAMLQLLVCAAGGARAEVFTFATRLTRVTDVLNADPATVLREVGAAAPDWSGGTRIGPNLKEFLERRDARELARGAVVVVISDGWESGETATLREQLARLSLLAHKIVWVNPRTAKPGYEPRVAGMAAALPYCDVMVSAHALDAIGELVAAIGGR
ncbi:hypothetical protein BAY61_03385 [Prauserella marina]|uniref:Uncharacterized protein n=1 Tax=Prauserella marina TaxID=530584 RepID=A0A222VJV6_9PSEU|nr:VWA domain-containing protein [Prauserella marina]ASR34195.1 hypothetical protein BAY61_03385 [Prauserella marina]PWV70871.1 hypothetical protein DES30_1147 [Prauserella marina]SDE02017.1 hypothetical protein SAMN05421630_11735 [Prauserella marina]